VASANRPDARVPALPPPSSCFLTLRAGSIGHSGGQASTEIARGVGGIHRRADYAAGNSISHGRAAGTARTTVIALADRARQRLAVSPQAIGNHWPPI
jgi:hypothetical protein